jgi:3-oxoacyl-[acyl-carrier-protein] synthase-3
MPGITIIGSGRYAPGKPVTNDALARVMDTTDEWIKQRTGIAERHFAPEGVGASDLALGRHGARSPRRGCKRATSTTSCSRP